MVTVSFALIAQRHHIKLHVNSSKGKCKFTRSKFKDIPNEESNESPTIFQTTIVFPTPEFLEKKYNELLNHFDKRIQSYNSDTDNL